MVDHLLHEEHRRAGVDGEDAVPERRRRLGDGRPVGDAGCIDETVDRAEAGEGAGQDVIRRVLLGEIRADERRLGAEGADFVGRGLAAILLAVAEDEGGGDQSLSLLRVRRLKCRLRTASPKGVSVSSSSRFIAGVRRSGTYQLSASDRTRSPQRSCTRR
jgi:hypothetical protein